MSNGESGIKRSARGSRAKKGATGIELSMEERLKICEKYVLDIGLFARTFFPHLMTSSSAKFHEEIFKQIPHHTYMCVQVFRGGAKSTIGLIIYSIWHSLFLQYGNIGLYSKSESFIMNEIMRVIKGEFERNERLRAFFGDLTTSKWAESFFVLKNGITFEGGGIGGQLRGGRKGLILLDDLEDEDSASSEEQRDKLRRRINKELIPKLVPNGQIIYFGTPIHNLAYIKQISDTPNNGWYKLKFPAYRQGIQQEGYEAWPEVFPHKRLQEIKRTMGSNEFSAEYMCEPISDGTRPIHPDQIRYWETIPTQHSSVLALDPAYSEDESADWKVCVMVSIDAQQNRYLSTYIRTHAQSGEYIDETINLWLLHKHEIQAIGIPNSGVEKQFFNDFLKRCNERKLYPPVVEIKNAFSTASGTSVRKKSSRIIAALQRLFEQGKYYIHANHMEARDELLSIGESRWDDLADAMAGAEQLLMNAYVPQEEEHYANNGLQLAYNGTTGYGI